MGKLNLKNLKPPFSSENQPKNRGKKKNPLKDWAEKNSVTRGQVDDALKNVFLMNEEEIKKAILDEKTPMIIKVAAKSIQADFKNGNIKSLMLILGRIYGNNITPIELMGDIELIPPKKPKQLTGE